MLYGACNANLVRCSRTYRERIHCVKTYKNLFSITNPPGQVFDAAVGKDNFWCKLDTEPESEALCQQEVRIIINSSNNNPGTIILTFDAAQRRLVWHTGHLSPNLLQTDHRHPWVQYPRRGRSSF